MFLAHLDHPAFLDPLDFLESHHNLEHLALLVFLAHLEHLAPHLSLEIPDLPKIHYFLVPLVFPVYLQYLEDLDLLFPLVHLEC